MLPILERIKEDHTSSSVFFTGDDGCRVLVNLVPPIKLRSLQELACYILDRMTFFSLAEVCRIVQINKVEINNELKRIFLSYPEKDFDKKFVHFHISW